MYHIDIVIATYNGEKYLAEQLDSIRQCDGYPEHVRRVIVIDDGSIDNTPNIIRAYQQVDAKIEWYPTKGPSLGPCLNFAEGLKKSTSPLVMLCDQDDVWRHDKLTKSLAALQTDNLDANKPLLVFSDVRIVDANLSTLSDSYFSHKRIAKSWHTSGEALLQQNVISGCTVMVNRPLLERALPIPQGAYMHDWWLGLHAYYAGQVFLIDEALVLYRQHSQNSIGANNRTLSDWCFRLSEIYTKFRKSFEQVILQAQAFNANTNSQYLTPTLSALCTFESLSRWQRLRLIKNGVLKRSHFLGNIGLIILALTKPVLHK